jgi:predicted small metal-binding protein
VLTCDCGFEARAADEDSLVAEVRRHASDAHGMTLSRDDAVLLIFHADLAGRPAAPGRIATKDEEER